MTPYCRATVATELPGTYDAATISRFNASGHRLLVRRSPFVPISEFVDTSTSRAASDQEQRLSQATRADKAVLSMDGAGDDVARMARSDEMEH